MTTNPSYASDVRKYVRSIYHCYGSQRRQKLAAAALQLVLPAPQIASTNKDVRHTSGIFEFRRVRLWRWMSTLSFNREPIITPWKGPRGEMLEEHTSGARAT